MDTDKNHFENLFSDEMPPSVLTEKIIGCAYSVGNALGCGFLEKVYENALAHEMRKAGFDVVQQRRMRILYDGVEVGYYDADLVVNDSIIVEVKAVRAIEDSHKAQCLNYLKGTGLRLGLLINFGSPRVEVRRVAL